MKKFLRWLFAAECEDFVLMVFSKDLYRRIDGIESVYRTTKELVMQKKLEELGFKIKNIFPRPRFTNEGEIIIEELPRHPSGFWEIINK